MTAALAIVTDYLYFSNLEWRYRTSRLNNKLTDREGKAAALLSETETYLSKGQDLSFLIHKSIGNTGTDEIIILVYTDDRISYWSDNSVSFPEEYESNFETHDPVFISNGWFIPIHQKYLNHDLIALIGVYRQYPIENSLLGAGFPDAYKLPRGTKITFDPDKSPFIITGVEDEFHFGLLFPEDKPHTIFIIIPVFFWLVLLLLWIYIVRVITYGLSEHTDRRVAMMTGSAALFLPYIILLVLGLPATVKSTELFSPLIYSAGPLFPSPGHILLASLLLMSGLYLMFSIYKVRKLKTDSSVKELVVSGILLALAFSFFLLAENLFRDLVTRSAINFEAYKILDIKFLSLAGFITVLILLSVPVIFFIRAFRIMQSLSLKRNFSLISIGFSIIPLLSLLGFHCSLWGIFYIISLAMVLLAWVRRPISFLNLTAIYAAITSLYATAIIIRFSDIRENENLKVLAVSLANDNDLVAESMLIDIWPVIKDDSVLNVMMDRDFFSSSDINTVYRYLQNTYFNGYWENYDLNIVICRDDSPLQITSQGSYASNCFVYFNERIVQEGDSITGTGFWFMHNQAGRAYYFSNLFYTYSPFLTNGLFIELVSHIEAYQAGYPELLLDATHQRFPRLKGISYAKYTDSMLVMRSGDFPYDTRMLPAAFNGKDYQITSANGHKHLFYNRGDMTLVITADAISSLDAIITFAYLFVTILVFSFILLLLFTRRNINLLKFDTFRRRLQMAFAGVLIIVFIIIITATFLLSTTQFKGNHTKILREKITSVSIELEHKLGKEKTLSNGWSSPDYFSLNELLVKFSNVFMTDINLYRTNGQLLASSRPEIFSEKLEGTLIDPSAFSALTVEGKPEYLGEETIGKLKYLSAYMPFYNENNQLLAFINLPYFEMQNILTGEISNLIVTLINFTLLLLILMMWLAVFLSERITSPLTLLQRAMASVEYGKRNEYIHYRGNDEVGELVKQYNRMIDELDESAGKLARSEREMAWREMARQIAHEIKNPLTPMKLNVQQLFKWWKDKTPDFSTKLEKFTENQIEYIDNLSSIASAFSYFARLPGANPTEVDVLAQLRTSLELFGQTNEAEINLESGNINKAVIMADKEHLNGIFSNLLKNAIQAIPAGKKGKITITLSATFDKILIVFRDNGIGIPEELKSKLFTPNFTTKSSGMGLGLSIVKRYVETAGGTIRFESERSNGTAFFVELPLLYTVERLGNHEN